MVPDGMLIAFHIFVYLKGDEASLQKAINGIGTNTHEYVVVLFYASWCPFSTILRPSLSTMSSLYPSIPHFAIEESTVKPRFATVMLTFTYPIYAYTVIHGSQFYMV